MSEMEWIKLYTNMFQDDKIRLIEVLPDRDIIIVIWIKLLVQAGKDDDNGMIYFDKDIPYTEEKLSHLFFRDVEDIRKALKILIDFRLIKILDDGKIKIINWKKRQDVEAIERARELSKLRMQNKRERDKIKHEIIKKSMKKENKKLARNINVTESNITNKGVTVTLQNKSKKEKENKNNSNKGILLRLSKEGYENLAGDGSDNHDFDAKELI